jgi:hypothetical protein
MDTPLQDRVLQECNPNTPGESHLTLTGSSALYVSELFSN